MIKHFSLLLLLVYSLDTIAQYPPPVGQEGTTAIHADSSVFIDWATTCEVNRGFMDISLPDSGFVSAGESYFATGVADNSIVSLGDGGSAILTFGKPISNGPGPDFAVFENAFLDDFLELAFVEVSSNGVDYYRIPSFSLTQTDIQIDPYGLLDATKLHNLAGKYRALYGVPFDLDDIIPSDNFDDFHVTHVRIISISGSINEAYANYDSQGNIINDPWPTMFPSGGFDLDAVGVIHNSSNGIEEKNSSFLLLYPNPASETLNFRLQEKLKNGRWSISDGTGIVRKAGEFGNCVLNTVILENLSPGIYYFSIQTERETHVQKFIKN